MDCVEKSVGEVAQFPQSMHNVSWRTKTATGITLEKVCKAVAIIFGCVIGCIPGLSTIVFLPLAGYNALRARFSENKIKDRYIGDAQACVLLAIPIVGNVLGVCVAVSIICDNIKKVFFSGSVKKPYMV